MIGPGPDQVRLGRMPVGAPIDAVGVGELRLVFAARADDEDLQVIGLVAVAAKDDPLAVGGDKRPAVVARGIGELLARRRRMDRAGARARTWGSSPVAASVQTAATSV